MVIEKNNNKLINAWCMYDWANSAYSLTITTAVFPGYYLAVTQEKVNFLGFELINSVLYSSALSFSFLIAAFLSPFLTAIADYTGRKKLFMQIFCYLGSFSCAYLFFFTSDNVTLGMIAFVMAGIGFSGSIVFYNSFLPEIATEDRVDKVSARGFSFGYIGSVLLLIVNLAMLLKPQFFGLHDDGEAARISFLTVGIWWFLFAQYSFYYLPSNVYKRTGEGNWIFNGLKELKKVFTDLEHHPLLKRFLLAFFFYNMGVQTVMYMATIFGKGELKLETQQLIIVILLIQIIAIPGAQLFARISGIYGNIKALMIIISIWIGVCIAAYYINNATQFYILAVVVGFVMGGVQSMSRSTYAKLIPENTIDHASYFSFYDVADKASTFAGAAMFGLINTLAGGMRPSALALGLFFILGIIFISRIPSLKSYNIKN